MSERRLVAISVDRVTIGDMMLLARMSKMGARIGEAASQSLAEDMEQWWGLTLSLVERYTNCSRSLAESLLPEEFCVLLQSVSNEMLEAQARWAAGDHAPVTAMCMLEVGGGDND